MAIGNCDCCDRRDVPGHVVNCPGEPFACYICQGDDDADPYSETEIEEPCPDCGGDGGHAYPVDIDRRDGSLIERWSRCDACNATGSVYEAPRLIDADDLAEMCGDQP